VPCTWACPVCPAPVLEVLPVGPALIGHCRAPILPPLLRCPFAAPCWPAAPATPPTVRLRPPRKGLGGCCLLTLWGCCGGAVAVLGGGPRYSSFMDSEVQQRAVEYSVPAPTRAPSWLTSWPRCPSSPRERYAGTRAHMPTFPEREVHLPGSSPAGEGYLPPSAQQRPC